MSSSSEPVLQCANADFGALEHIVDNIEVFSFKARKPRPLPYYAHRILKAARAPKHYLPAAAIGLSILVPLSPRLLRSVLRLLGRSSLQTRFTALAVFATAFKPLYQYFTARRLTAAEEEEARVALVQADSDAPFTRADEELIVMDTPKGKKARRHRWLPVVVRTIKNDMGVPIDCASNRSVIRKKYLALAVAHGLRPTHIAETIDVAIELVLLPSKNQVGAAKTRQSNVFRDRWTEFKYWGGQVLPQ